MTKVEDRVIVGVPMPRTLKDAALLRVKETGSMCLAAYVRALVQQDTVFAVKIREMQ
jgi:hypothetical protein